MASNQMMNCPICKKPYKGKIGVGVHLKRSHTIEERGKYHLECIMDILPTIMVILILAGAYALTGSDIPIPKIGPKGIRKLHSMAKRLLKRIVGNEPRNSANSK